MLTAVNQTFGTDDISGDASNVSLLCDMGDGNAPFSCDSKCMMVAFIYY